MAFAFATGLVACVALVAASRAGAQAAPQVTATRVAGVARDLAATDAGTRRRAWQWLTGLSSAAVPAIEARVNELARHPLDPKKARNALYAFRHAVGSLRADDMVDIAPGVLPVLGRRRDGVTVAMAERLALERALEHIGTLRAGEVMVELMGIEGSPWPWRWEAGRVVQRMGVRILPALLVAAGHPNVLVRRWARSALDDLGLGDPGAAVRGAERAGVGVLADLLRAYGQARIIDAMPTVAAFVADPRHQVRDAARAAAADYGRNIIWQLRRVYHLQTGRDASLAWSAKRTRDELFAAIDAERLAPARKALDAGLAALRHGNLVVMERDFDAVLREAPDAPELARAMAGGWSVLGQRRLARGEYVGAAHAYRRALSPGPGGSSETARRRWLARLVLARAEASLSMGVVDLPGYREAVRLDPHLREAAAAVDHLSGAASARDHARKRWAAAIAAFLLALAGAGLLYFKRTPPTLPHQPQPWGDPRPPRRVAALHAGLAPLADPPATQGPDLTG